MNSADGRQKIWIDTREQLGTIPKVLSKLHELVPLLSVAYTTDRRTFGYEAGRRRSGAPRTLLAASTAAALEILHDFPHRLRDD